ncbi:RJL, ras superfamily GTPase [Tribonema minus]|uniref:RJL, ras superfamily GTPase n=1 Tax=Tribonema minus TaxID=303371 RepID=A0A836CR06_9STRA|nr:RJL, ras superfamily GTPase [Tribonema minus]
MAAAVQQLRTDPAAGGRRRSRGIDDLYTTRAAEAPQKKHWCVRIKIISMGSLATGKSCLIKRFCEERFVTKYISTIGIDYGVKPVTVRGQQVRVNFWDLSGHPDFFEIRNEFYKDSQGALLVFDVSRRESFEELQDWLSEAAKFGAQGMPVVVCANKVDKKRAVTEEEGQRWARERGYPYFETSANSGANVAAVFGRLFEAAFDKMQQEST